MLLQNISIHALLAESDHLLANTMIHQKNFYPRSPCGERLKSPIKSHRQKHFYPRSPCGERHEKRLKIAYKGFYFYPRSPCGERLHSVPSFVHLLYISIHALLAESDEMEQLRDVFHQIFLSTLSLRRATCYSFRRSAQSWHFYPRSPCGERQG